MVSLSLSIPWDIGTTCTSLRPSTDSSLQQEASDNAALMRSVPRKAWLDTQFKPTWTRDSNSEQTTARRSKDLSTQNDARMSLEIDFLQVCHSTIKSTGMCSMHEYRLILQEQSLLMQHIPSSETRIRMAIKPWDSWMIGPLAQEQLPHHRSIIIDQSWRHANDITRWLTSRSFSCWHSNESTDFW